MRLLRTALLYPVISLVFLLAGLGARLGTTPAVGNRVWLAGLILVGLPVAWRTMRGMLQGKFASDVVAMLAILGAVALAQPFAGLIVVLMQTGGEALERYAEGRASRAIHELEKLAPRIAHRQTNGQTADVPVKEVRVGDVLLVRPGEVVPCDGTVASGRPHLDLSRLTGEPLPVSVEIASRVRSGSHNLESPFELLVTAPASQSEYAKIVELVRSAQSSKAPLQRLADRYAVWFTPLTLIACALTFLVSHDLVRVLAVLVVATPCPLILATPVAIVGGINRAASRGIVFRHGTALEQLATVNVAVFDKTGTLTIGRPEVAQVIAVGQYTEEEILSLAAAVERGSGHLLARTLVEAAARRGVPTLQASNIIEAPGQGVSGLVDGRRVAIGGWEWLRARVPEAASDLGALTSDRPTAGLRAFVAVEDHGAGIVEYADQLRPGIAELIQRLHGLGIERVLMLSGDRTAAAQAVASLVGIQEARGDLSPGEKTGIVQALTKRGDHVLMLGDGTNDAPALSAASVGIALASGGGGIAAEAADAVILADDPNRIAEAVLISRRTLRIAHQSIWTGLGLSALAMVVAGFGALPPAVGALVQEAIDVAVILNALRAAGGPAPPTV